MHQEMDRINTDLNTGSKRPDDRSMEFERLTRTNSDLQATIARLNQDIDRLTQENRMAKMRSGSESERLA
jgi:predicted RNase H-like nuclease (RuvC/YqgF family)